jgi:hypothetical protein
VCRMWYAVRADVSDFVERCYDPIRTHFTLGYPSPSNLRTQRHSRVFGAAPKPAPIRDGARTEARRLLLSLAAHPIQERLGLPESCTLLIDSDTADQRAGQRSILTIRNPLESKTVAGGHSRRFGRRVATYKTASSTVRETRNLISHNGLWGSLKN